MDRRLISWQMTLAVRIPAVKTQGVKTQVAKTRAVRTPAVRTQAVKTPVRSWISMRLLQSVILRIR